MEEQEMFFNENVARRFAKSEENEKNIRVCQTIEKIIIKFLEVKKIFMAQIYLVARIQEDIKFYLTFCLKRKENLIG